MPAMGAMSKKRGEKMSKLSLLENQLNDYQGVARMKPTWLPRTFLPPGRRLKIHPDDIYAFGVEKGGIAERWFVSTGAPVTGETTIDESTMSFFYLGKGEEGISFPEAIALMGNELLGKETMQTLGTFKMFAKLYDYGASLPLHLHPQEQFTKMFGLNQKPESYYFPIELNAITLNHDYTFFGLNPGTTKEEVLECIKNYGMRDTQMLTLSRAYKIKLGTGWFLPAGILHAPASLVTYEPQYMSDVSVWYQNIVEAKYVIDERMNDVIIPKDITMSREEYLLSILDWDANVDPNFREKYYHEPIPVRKEEDMLEDGYYERWVSYGSKDFAAKELRVLPGRTVTIKDDAAYGFIMMQGYGTINGMEINTPAVIRVGQQTADEGFVIKAAAERGVVIQNQSQFSEIVMLKHFNGDSKAALAMVQE